MSTDYLKLPHLGPFVLLPLLGQIHGGAGGGHLGKPSSSKREEKPNRSFMITVATVGTKQSLLDIFILLVSRGVLTGFKSGR